MLKVVVLPFTIKLPATVTVSDVVLPNVTLPVVLRVPLIDNPVSVPKLVTLV